MPDTNGHDSTKKVYSIWLCMDASEDEDSIHKIQLTNQTVYGKPVVLQELDKMCAVVIRLRKNNSIGDSKDILISMLEELLSNKDKEEKKQNLIIKYGMKMTTQMERRLNIMCNYSDIVEEIIKAVQDK